jgi:hypothetical protein
VGIAEESAALAADSVAEGIKRKREQYWPDEMRKPFLSLLDWAFAQNLLDKRPAAQEFTAEALTISARRERENKMNTALKLLEPYRIPAALPHFCFNR